MGMIMSATFHAASLLVVQNQTDAERNAAAHFEKVFGQPHVCYTVPSHITMGAETVTCRPVERKVQE